MIHDVCKRGHEFTKANTIKCASRGYTCRKCRICNNKRMKRYMRTIRAIKKEVWSGGDR